jgi:hypothetical protein
VAALDVEMIRAVYANLGVLSDPERWNRLIEIAETTEINAIVIDVKQDTIYYDTQVPFYRDIDGMITPIFDPQELLAELDARGIYSIARMVVFKDPVVAAGRPDLAVRDEVSGDLWLDMNGTPWVNAFNQELWEANADLGAELAQTTTSDSPLMVTCEPLTSEMTIPKSIDVLRSRARLRWAEKRFGQPVPCSLSICFRSLLCWVTIKGSARRCRISPR